MSKVYHHIVCDSLYELSSIEEQKRLWLSTGANGSEVSSLTEAREGLYTDSVLGDMLDAGAMVYSQAIDDKLKKLESLLRKVDSNKIPKDIINDPAMAVVRKLAGEILIMLKDHRVDDTR